MTIRAHRRELTDYPDDLKGSDYASTFEAGIQQGDTRSPEEWAQAMFEHGPALIRLFVVFGWRFVLWLELGSAASSANVAGWKVQSYGTDMIRLEASSRMLHAEKEVRVVDDSVRVSTFVKYRSTFGRAVWALVVPIHHHTEPYLLSHAALQSG